MAHFPIEKFAQLDTPLYYYDISLLHRTLDAMVEAQPHGSVVHYALKANSNMALLRAIAQRGLGADCVSGGEIVKAIEAGFAPHNIVYAGVGKTDAEIKLAIEQGIGCFNVESVAELNVINEIASNYKKRVPIALRVNPHIDAHTHRNITTGLSENKFGIDITQLDAVITLALSLENIVLYGLHFHIGSQITSFEPFAQLAITINRIQEKLALRDIILAHINVGGGLGVDYQQPDKNAIPDFQGYFDTFKSNLILRQGTTLHFELGRSIVCQCGTLITRVLYIKEGLSKRFAIVDAGMTDLMRPALYQAEHKIENISSHTSQYKYDVVGPICETTDSFASDILLSETHRGDFLAIRSAGAYGESMASHYNSRPLPSHLIG